MTKAKTYKVNEEFWAWWHAQPDRDTERAVILAEKAWDAGRLKLAIDIHNRRKLTNRK